MTAVPNLSLWRSPLLFASVSPPQDVHIDVMHFLYDSAGAMTHDPYKSVCDISYDNNGMPKRVSFHDGSFTDYRYALDGTRLKEMHGSLTRYTLTVDGKLQSVTATAIKDSTVYISPWLEHDGNKYRYKFPGGYYAFTVSRSTHEPLPGRFYLYECDHQGNVRSVVQDNGGFGKEVQQTHYYPFGGTIAGIGTAPGFQRRKYNGKELDRMFGLDLYDYGARQYDPVLLCFTSPDPLAEKSYGTSMYGYCKNSPTSKVDPNGLFDFMGTIMPHTGYAVIGVFPRDFLFDRAMLKDFCNAYKSIPVVLVDDMNDFADAMAFMDKISVTNDVYTINSHGFIDYEKNKVSFNIGTECVTSENDFSLLEKGLNGHIVFIGACNVGINYGDSGYELVESIARQTNSSVIAASHPIRAGYKYDGSLALNRKNPFDEFDLGNTYIKSVNGELSETIYDVSIDRMNGISWKGKTDYRYVIRPDSADE